MDQVWIKFTWRRSSRRLVSRVCKFRFVKNRLVLIAQAYTHTHAPKFDIDFQEQKF